MSEIEKALVEFVSTIENTGGVCKDAEGLFPVPVADPEWLDMGIAYVRACKVLGREPMIQGGDDEP